MYFPVEHLISLFKVRRSSRERQRARMVADRAWRNGFPVAHQQPLRGLQAALADQVAGDGHDVTHCPSLVGHQHMRVTVPRVPLYIMRIRT